MAAIDNMPGPIARLPRTPEGVPIPWFVQRDPLDLSKTRPMAAARAHTGRLCWWCGEPRYEKRMCFMVEPAAVISHVAAGPPSHPACARWAASVAGLPAVIIHVTGYTLLEVDGAVVFGMLGIRSIEWWSEGRQATRGEARLMLEGVLPELEELARQAGPEAVCDLEIATAEVFHMLPRDAA